MTFAKNILKIDTEQETDRVAGFIKHQTKDLRKNGVIVGLSGGIDSAVMAELAVRAMGKEHVFGLCLPEKESNPVSTEYAVAHAEAMGIEHRVTDITSTVDAVVSY
ncbi:MAG: asparagine synthase-related protein, partial [Thermodesulfobacteriota bacterium]|nr:asparagine synthase-related protein [Thermodesulfobacteriota bacterium]